jgi:homoserine kinase
MSGPSSTKRALSVAAARARIEGVTIEVPASIANLGPGFDALAVAVQLYLRVTVRRVIEAAPGTITSNLGLGDDDYVCRSVSTLAAREGLELPGLELEIASDIPMQAGLGSSAAAIVGGLLLYDRLVGTAGRDLLAEATAFEGHPDNVAAALLGGLTAACASGQGKVIAVSSAWPDQVRFVAATPDVRVKTAEARRVLPAEISRADAVFNLQRVALLLQAIRTGRTEVLREALADRWHQPYRAPLVPGLSDALALTHPDLLGVCLSGSGPTVVALCAGETSGVEKALAGIYSRLGLPCRFRILAAHNGPPRVIESS